MHKDNFVLWNDDEAKRSIYLGNLSGGERFPTKEHEGHPGEARLGHGVAVVPGAVRERMSDRTAKTPCKPCWPPFPPTLL